MTFNDILKESWLSISGNKVRSFLTILGVIIGVMAVVVMVTVGETVQKQIDAQFSSLGTNTIIVRAGAARSLGVRSGNVQTLTAQDAEALRMLPDVEAITPTASGAAQIIFGNKNWATSMTGAWPSYATVQNIELERGAFYDMSAVRNASTVAVIGPKTARELDMPEDPIGQIVRVLNTPVTIIGVTKEKGDSAFGSQDDMLLLPISTLRKRIQGSRFPDSVSMITLKLYADADNALVIEQITAVLRDRHKLKDTDVDDFQIMDMKQMMDAMNSVAGFMKLLLIAIASVSLLVGSIGIMNMMLVSVAERTREIGIRKAIGAKENHIIIQFLAESLLISFLGSMTGLIIGVAGSLIFIPMFMDYGVTISTWAVIMSFIVAIVVGIASGVFPAIKAAKLNPIDSLRHE